MFSLSRAGLLLLISTAGLTAQPPAMPDNVIFEPNLNYAPGAETRVDIVRPRENSGAPHPAVLCIHGGGFRGGDKPNQNRAI